MFLFHRAVKPLFSAPHRSDFCRLAPALRICSDDDELDAGRTRACLTVATRQVATVDLDRLFGYFVGIDFNTTTLAAPTTSLVIADNV